VGGEAWFLLCFSLCANFLTFAMILADVAKSMIFIALFGFCVLFKPLGLYKILPLVKKQGEI